MNNSFHIPVVALVAIGAVGASECRTLPSCTGWKIEKTAEFTRPAEPSSLSSVTRVAAGVYWTATDWDSQIWEMRFGSDASGLPDRCILRPLANPKGAVDVEGIAFDPLAGGVWIADEDSAAVKRYDPLTGAVLAEASVPGQLKRFRRHTGIESLAISGDGLRMWTCTEEAVDGDGPRSSRKAGTDVRLARMVRSARDAAWKADGQWVYRTDPIAGGAWFNKKGQDVSRSGVSALCVPAPDTLLVLEREFSKVFIPRLRCRIYAVDLAGASDVAGIGKLDGADGFVRAEKKLLYETSGFSMYEGMCADSPGKDGSIRLVLVSDGDKKTLCSVLVLKLIPSAGKSGR